MTYFSTLLNYIRTFLKYFYSNFRLQNFRQAELIYSNVSSENLVRDAKDIGLKGNNYNLQT